MKSERRGKFGERKKKVLICAVLFATLAFLSVSVGCASAATTIYVPEGGNQTIQQAVNNATEGDTIIVKDGTYTENVNVNVNHLTIQSENGSASTIVQAAIPDDHVFEIIANHVNLSGFAVENATQGTTPYTAGIYLYYVEHCNISDNTVSNNFGGIGLNYSNNNIISNNNASSNMDISIVLGSSNNNTIYNNTASSNTGVDYSGHVYSWGICVGNSSNNNITANTANSNAGDIGWGIYIGGASNNNTLADNNFSNNFFGVYLISSSNNTLTNNIASNNACGIYLWSSSNYNTLTNNTASNSIAYDFYSHENSHGNTVGNLTISSHQTTISFTYDQGIGLKGATTPNSDPPGKVNIGKFVIVMNETANSWIFLNVSYCDADITSTQESTLRMWKYNGTT
jgi:parallel beta-helix repeat protein